MVRAGAGSASAADLLHSRATPTNPPPHVAGERLTTVPTTTGHWYVITRQGTNIASVAQVITGTPASKAKKLGSQSLGL